MNTKLATSRIRTGQWADIIKDCKESGLKVDDYCAQHGLSRNAYFYWLPSHFLRLYGHGNRHSGNQEPVIPAPETAFRYAYCIVLICCSSKSSFLFCVRISMSFCILMKYSFETPNNFESRREVSIVIFRLLCRISWILETGT